MSFRPNMRKDNSTGRYKIKVGGLPRFYAIADPLLQEFLHFVRVDLKLNCIYARFVQKGNAWLVLTFPTVNEQLNALSTLKNCLWKGRTLVCLLVTSDEILKRKTDDDDSLGELSNTSRFDSKKLKVMNPISEQVLMTTIPYYTVSYEEQLKQKNEEARNFVMRLQDILLKQSPQLFRWCKHRRQIICSDTPFILDMIIPSPVIYGYRNKYEFSVGINPDTGKVSVGIRVQDKRDGIHHVGPCDSLLQLPKSMITLAKEFENFVQSYDKDWDYWYHLIIRTNRKREAMVTVSTNPNKKGISNVVLDRLKREVVQCFKRSSQNVVSVYFQCPGDKRISDTVGLPNRSDLLWGEEYIRENLLNLKLEITPVTYFRINSSASEILCKAVLEVADVNSTVTVLDLFCGSGSLSLTIAPHCKEVIGVDLIECNILDAKRYAEKNYVTNCEFVCGKIEDMIDSILERQRNKNVVVILDPPRSGMDPALTKKLRDFKESNRFIYICSNHKLPLKNLLEFSVITDDPEESDPIIPVRIIPVDMTPHTLRSELVIQCERFDLNGASNYQGCVFDFPPPWNIGSAFCSPYYNDTSIVNSTISATYDYQSTIKPTNNRPKTYYYQSPSAPWNNISNAISTTYDHQSPTTPANIRPEEIPSPFCVTPVFKKLEAATRTPTHHPNLETVATRFVMPTVAPTNDCQLNFDPTTFGDISGCGYSVTAIRSHLYRPPFETSNTTLLRPTTGTNCDYQFATMPYESKRLSTIFEHEMPTNATTSIDVPSFSTAVHSPQYHSALETPKSLATSYDYQSPTMSTTPTITQMKTVASYGASQTTTSGVTPTADRSPEPLPNLMDHVSLSMSSPPYCQQQLKNLVSGEGLLQPDGGSDFTVDRYSNFRKDFENAIESSYGSTTSENALQNFLPLDVVKQIEERALNEELNCGIQQNACQVGYQKGLNAICEQLNVAIWDGSSDNPFLESSSWDPFPNDLKQAASNASTSVDAYPTSSSPINDYQNSYNYWNQNLGAPSFISAVLKNKD